MSNSTLKPIIFAKFTEEPILGENGRLVHAILNAFSMDGYRIRLFEDMDFGELGRPGQLIYDIRGLELVDANPVSTKNTIYLFDEATKDLAKRTWSRKIQIKFDIFSSYMLTSYTGREPIILPYPMHPSNYTSDFDARLDSVRNSKKAFRILFSGDTKGYVTNRTFYPKPKLTRAEIIQTVIEALDNNVHILSDNAALDSALNGNFIKKFVLVDTSRVWINPWLDNLAKSEFFLCPPGICMPMSHNAIEAMGVGVIPIINYPEWFAPALTHMENCIIFDEKRDLIERIDQVLNLDQKEIERIRNNVIHYYENYLKPQTFVDDIERKKGSKITVLMRTSECSIKNAKKLNSRSVLIRHALASNCGP